MHHTLQPPNAPLTAPEESRPAVGSVRVDKHLLAETDFVAAIHQERGRSERSGKPFLLMLASLPQATNHGWRRAGIYEFVARMKTSVRETDVVGWHRQGQRLGFIFTELGDADKDLVLLRVKQRVNSAILDTLEKANAVPLALSFYFFPDDSRHDLHAMDPILYPESTRHTWHWKLAQGVKRVIDFLGSALALALLFPLLLTIALSIKATSKGPVLFRQSRVGHRGKAFMFLKFRSMNVNNDATIHEEYVSRFIAGEAEANSTGTQSGVYKITQDPRVTPLGRVLRKTSLDELPQLFNVLKGEMSLVGPRPPIPYEFQRYDPWHRRRVFEMRPGITGMWQVNGRSRTSFDDMVRLDLQYARKWSLWLDLKILLQTPRVVIFGDGAY